MGDDPASLRLLVVGASHRSSSASFRERLFSDMSAVPTFLEGLRRAGIGQALLLATCDRVEVQAFVPDPDGASAAVAAALAGAGDIDADEASGQLYRLEGRQAVRHVFAVAASLDSLVPGEAQILGQVRDSHRVAREAGMLGPELDAVLDAAYRAAKRVRSETTIGERPVSIAAAAERLARGIHGDLARASAVLVAGGEMGELIVDHLIRAGLGRLTVTARIARRAEMLARRLSCHAVPFETLDDLLAEADIVISAIGAAQPLITREMVARALAARRRRPVFVIDAAIPGDVHAAVDALDDAFLYDLGDLEATALDGRRRRDAEARRAAGIVDEELEAYYRDRAGRVAAPLAAAIRRRFEAEREAVLRRAGGDADEATRRLVNRLLHGPLVALREISEEGGDREAVEALVRRLFGLVDDGGGEGEEEK